MNEAPQAVFKLILDEVQEQMRFLSPEIHRFQRLSSMQSMLAATTIFTILPMSTGTCEECHATARGVVVISAVALKRIYDELMAILSDPEHSPIPDILAELRDTMASVGTAPGALTEQDLIELGIHEAVTAPDVATLQLDETPVIDQGTLTERRAETKTVAGPDASRGEDVDGLVAGEGSCPNCQAMRGDGHRGRCGSRARSVARAHSSTERMTERLFDLPAFKESPKE